MKSLIYLLSVLFLLFHSVTISAQEETKKTHTNKVLISVGYGYHFSGGDLKNRYGNNSSFEIGLGLLHKDQYKIALEYNYHFGNVLKEDVLLQFRGSDNKFVTSNNDVKAIDLRERIRLYKLSFYYTIPFNKKNKKTGIQIGLSPGYLEHFIKFRTDNIDFAQLEGDYLKGYDRLTGGFSISEYIGITIISDKNNYNFNFGFEFTQAFTKSQRAWDYFEFKYLDEKRLDLLTGIKASWVLPININTSKQKVYY